MTLRGRACVRDDGRTLRWAAAGGAVGDGAFVTTSAVFLTTAAGLTLVRSGWR
jgi:hypothetical protein